MIKIRLGFAGSAAVDLDDPGADSSNSRHEHETTGRKHNIARVP
jgi:hypothetical protein